MSKTVLLASFAYKTLIEDKAVDRAIELVDSLTTAERKALRDHLALTEPKTKITQNLIFNYETQEWI